MNEKAVGYLRYSSENQREESLDAQRRAIKEYCKRENYEYTGEYIDSAKSGTSDKRPEFQRMIDDSSKNKFDYVIVHKMDRFSRNKFDFVFYKRELKINRVRVLSVTEQFEDTPESAILESLLEAMAEYYSKNLAREVMKGLIENALNCKHTGGIPPLGFDINAEKKYIINTKEAEAVKMIFQMYLEDKTSREIIRTLNDLGYKTKKGSDWSKDSLSSIVRNEKYIGNYIFNKSSSKNEYGKRNNHKKKSEDKIIRIEGGIPAIIDKETFEQVQQKLDGRRMSPIRETKQVYLLSGLVKCECGFGMYGNVRRSKKKKKAGDTTVSSYVSYRCGCRTKKGLDKCSNKEIRKEYLEEFILSQLEKEIFNEETITALVEKSNQYLKQENSTMILFEEKLKKEIAETQKKIGNLIDVLASGVVSDDIKERLSSLGNEKSKLENELKNIAVKVKEECTLTSDEVREHLKRLGTFIQNNNIPEVKKFINSFITEIKVTKNTVEVGLAPLSSFFGNHSDYKIYKKIKRTDLYTPLKRCMSLKGGDLKCLEY